MIYGATREPHGEMKIWHTSNNNDDSWELWYKYNPEDFAKLHTLMIVGTNRSELSGSSMWALVQNVMYLSEEIEKP